MPSKKGGKAKPKKSGAKKSSKKKSAGKRSSAKKPKARKTGGKKTAHKGQKVAAKKSGAKKSGAKKSAAPSKSSAKAGKAPATTFTLSAPAEVLIGNCIGLGTAGTFVERAVVAVGGISPGDFDIDKKFEQMGVITANQCQQVLTRVLQDVRNFPCTIDTGSVSCAPGDKARALRDALQANAGLPS